MNGPQTTARVPRRDVSRQDRRSPDPHSRRVSRPAPALPQENIQDTVVFFGSARVHSRQKAERALLRLTNRRRAQARRPRRGAQAEPEGGGVVALLRGRARAGAPADRVEHVARRGAPPVRRLLGRRARHHGGRQPRRDRSRRQDDRPQHPAAVRAGAQSATSPRACTSSSTTSSCASSGSPTWRRRW